MKRTLRLCFICHRQRTGSWPQEMAFYGRQIAAPTLQEIAQGDSG